LEDHLMKHRWALLGTLALTSTLVVSGVAANAAPTSGQGTTADRAQGSGSVAVLVPTLPAHGFYWQLTSAQPVEAGKVLLARKGGHGRSVGTRSDKQFFEISTTGSNDVPQAALRAYHHAERVMARALPGCDISWTLLAAIGRVESNHGRFGGAQLGADGVSRPEIRGPRLDGAGPFAAIRDSDKGKLDRDKVWDRAVGQMQFLPETWRSVARDGDADGRMDPDDIDDSALGSAVYLCGAGGSVAPPEGMARAAFRYNHSDYYVRLVIAFQAGYQTGVFAMPSPPPPPPPKRVVVPRKPATAAPAAAPGPRTPKSVKPAPRPTPAPSVKPPRSTPSATPKPSVKPAPSPAPAGPKTERGTWKVCGASFCLGSTALDLGPLATRGSRAEADFDGDGVVESNGDEFTGLDGRQVTLLATRNAGGIVVLAIDGHAYRNADGSLARASSAP
jgi:hypothetical protein